MGKINKLETVAIAIIIILYFLLIKGYFSSSIYLVIVLTVSFYFMPFKLISIFKNNKEDKIFLFISTFTISVILSLSYISYALKTISESFNLWVLFFEFLNLFLAYHFATKKNKIYYIHLLLCLMIPIVLLVN
jgi:hypothetical protein